MTTDRASSQTTSWSQVTLLRQIKTEVCRSRTHTHLSDMVWHAVAINHSHTEWLTQSVWLGSKQERSFHQSPPNSLGASNGSTCMHPSPAVPEFARARARASKGSTWICFEVHLCLYQRQGGARKESPAALRRRSAAPWNLHQRGTGKKGLTRVCTGHTDAPKVRCSGSPKSFKTQWYVTSYKDFTKQTGKRKWSTTAPSLQTRTGIFSPQNYHQLRAQVTTWDAKWASRDIYITTECSLLASTLLFSQHLQVHPHHGRHGPLW